MLTTARNSALDQLRRDAHYREKLVAELRALMLTENKAERSLLQRRLGYQETSRE